MTVSTDLALNKGIERRLFLKIDGFEPILWQEAAVLTGYSRSGITCLHAPTEMSTVMDLGEMWQDMNAVSFELDDYQVASTNSGYAFTSYFGQLFSTARYDGINASTYDVDPATTPQVFIEADQTTLALKNTDGLSAIGGTLYFGQETITYTGIAADGKTLTGVSRGLYPCTSASNWGYTIFNPRLDADSEPSPIVSTVPFTWHGRRVALYVTTKDPQTGVWATEANAKLLWIGRLTNTINYDADKNTWILSCESILSELDKELCTKQKSAHLAPLLNFKGTIGRDFRIEYQVTTDVTVGGVVISTVACSYLLHADISIASFVGDVDHACNVLTAAIKSATWKNYAGNTVAFDPRLTIYVNPVYNKVCCYKWRVTDVVFGGYIGQERIRFITYSNNGQNQNYLFHALGFAKSPADWCVDLDFDWSNEGANGGYAAIMKKVPHETYVGYHPVLNEVNGGVMYVVESENELLSNQGDAASTRAYFRIDDIPYTYETTQQLYNKIYDTTTNYGQTNDAKTNYYGSYTAFTTEVLLSSIANNKASSFTFGKYTLGAYRQASVAPNAAMKFKAGDALPEIKQVYIPESSLSDGTIVGPYTMILKMLCSTGSNAYNGAYDVFHSDLSCGIEAALIDTQSFIDADNEIKTNPLADRRFYVFDDVVTMKEVIQREAKLFGKGICWRNGKLTVTDMMSIPLDEWTVELSDSNYAMPDERTSFSMSTDSVINRYNCKLTYNPITQKYGKEYVINDSLSVLSLGAKAIDIEHPGIFMSDRTSDDLNEILSKQLIGRYYRAPLPVVERSISSVLLNKLDAGDKVKFTSSYFHDPMGSGTRSTTCYAIVLNVNRNYENWKGTVTLLLLTRFQSMGYPWAPSAVANYAHATNGWNSASQKIYLQNWGFGNSATDSDDGATFQAGQKIKVFVRDCDWPGNTSNIESWGPYTVASAYETDGAGILTLSDANTGGGALPAFSNAKEYVIEYCDWSDAVTNMESNAIWQAGTGFEKLGYNPALVDTFSDSAKAFTEQLGNGVITEGSLLTMNIPAATNCEWSADCPVAYYSIPSRYSTALNQKYTVKLVGSSTPTNFNSGLVLFSNATYAYFLMYGAGPSGPQNIQAAKIVNGVVTNIASLNIGVNPSVAAPIFLQIDYGADVDSSMSYGYSLTGQSFTELVSSAKAFTPSSVGVLMKDWATFPAAMVSANFGLLQEIEYGGDWTTVPFYRWG